MTRNRQMTRLVTRALVSGVVALTLLAGVAAPPAHGATLQPMVARMMRTMTAATAYTMVSDSTTSGGGAMMGGASTTHLEMIHVHHGPTTQLSMLSETKGAKGPVRVSEMVVVGTRGCLRTSHTGAWNCHYPSTMFAAMTTTDPAKALQGTGLRLVMAATGRSRTIRGQSCAVYSFTESMNVGVALTMHGTWCLNPATMLPVEVDSVGSETLVKGQPPFLTRSTMIFSRWNDPTLRVPTVRGL